MTISISLALSGGFHILRRELTGYFKDVWETYWIFFCRRSGSSQTSGPLTQLLNLSLFPELLSSQSSTPPPDLTFTHELKQAIPCCFEAADGGLGSSVKCFLNGV